MRGEAYGTQKKVVDRGVKWCIGNGEGVRIWKDR